MNEKMMKAQVAMLKVQERALEKGMVISLPTVEGMRYDCIVDDGSKLLKAQVKYAGGSTPSRGGGAVHVSLSKAKGRGLNRPYSSDEIDLILVYVACRGQVCAFPPEDFEGKENLNIRHSPAKNGQIKGCVMVDDRVW